ncbi:MAG: BTAD domain-containing putative transcriptional regulator [Burkholderiales bacterium]
MSAPETPAAAAADGPALRLLGTPSLRRDGREAPLAPDRAHGLLAYLACRRDWVRRDELAELLYPGRDLDDARSNLRKVIHLARKAEGAQALEQRGDLLRWMPDSDLARFDGACDRKQCGIAVALYGGMLLLGLDAAWPPAAREWLEAERARLQSRWHDACARRLAELRDDPPAARALAEAMLRHDPLDDVALQALARAQQALGQPEAALSAVQDFTRRVTRELRLEPSVAVRRLEDDLRRVGEARAPAATPSLVGRRHERTQAHARLADPACRVLTLLGPPGVGKSALARSLADECDGRWVPLEAVARIEAVPGIVADALGVSPEARLDPWTGLAQAIGARPVLLVLDNAETLPLAGPLAALLAACPALRIVATSRAPLGVTGEWRLPLDGLPLPDLDERDPEVLRANDAVALFERCVLPLVPAFDLGAEAADVVQLVHAVEGLPLALEMLAAWRRVMPVGAIREELAASLDLLESPTPGERSVRAAFDRSWRQLSESEQRVLARCARLPGACDREMARAVVPAPLPVLAALVDRSLLRLDEQGRFSLHPLLRRCAAPLADDADALRERHARHVAATCAQSTRGDGLPHIFAAWDWGVERGDPAVLGALAGALGARENIAGRGRDNLARARAAGAVLRQRVAAAEAETESAHRRDLAQSLGRVLVAVAHLSYLIGDLDDCLLAAREARDLARRWGPATVERAAWVREASVHWQRGDYDAAESAFGAAIALAREAGDAASVRALDTWLALVA